MVHVYLIEVFMVGFYTNNRPEGNNVLVCMYVYWKCNKKLITWNWKLFSKKQKKHDMYIVHATYIFWTFNCWFVYSFVKQFTTFLFIFVTVCMYIFYDAGIQNVKQQMILNNVKVYCLL
jgi:hypothetical protein